MESKSIQFILIIEFCFIDQMIWLIDFNHVFFLLFIYLIDANANDENWIYGFPKSVYYIVVPRRCVFFPGFFFFLENQTMIDLFLIIIHLLY